MPGVFDCAEPFSCSRTARECVAFRWGERRRRSGRVRFRSSIPCLCVPLPTLRYCSREQQRMAWGRRGLLALRRTALSSTPPCRFIPAHSPPAPPSTPTRRPRRDIGVADTSSRTRRRRRRRIRDHDPEQTQTDGAVGWRCPAHCAGFTRLRVAGDTQRLLRRRHGNGRLPAVELLRVNRAVATLIREAKTAQIPSVLQSSAREGMLILERSLADRVQAGEIQAEAAYAAANDPETLAIFLKH